MSAGSGINTIIWQLPSDAHTCNIKHIVCQESTRLALLHAYTAVDNGSTVQHADNTLQCSVTSLTCPAPRCAAMSFITCTPPTTCTLQWTHPSGTSCPLLAPHLLLQAASPAPMPAAPPACHRWPAAHSPRPASPSCPPPQAQGPTAASCRCQLSLCQRQLPAAHAVVLPVQPCWLLQGPCWAWLRQESSAAALGQSGAACGAAAAAAAMDGACAISYTACWGQGDLFGSVAAAKQQLSGFPAMSGL